MAGCFVCSIWFPCFQLFLQCKCLRNCKHYGILSNKCLDPGVCSYGLRLQLFSCEYCELFKNNFLVEHLLRLLLYLDIRGAFGILNICRGDIVTDVWQGPKNWHKNSPRILDINWTSIRRSEDFQDFFWTSYIRSIYVLCPGGCACHCFDISRKI